MSKYFPHVTILIFGAGQNVRVSEFFLFVFSFFLGSNFFNCQILSSKYFKLIFKSSFTLIHSFVFFCVFCVGWASCFLEQQLINCFGKIRMVLKRTFKWFTVVVLKGPIEGLADVLMKLLFGVG